MPKAELVQVIKTNLLTRGDGKNEALRKVTQYWDGKGSLLAELDVVQDQQFKDQCIDIGALNDFINKEIPEIAKDINNDLPPLRRVSMVLNVFKDMVDAVRKTNKDPVPEEETENVPEVKEEDWDVSLEERLEDSNA